MVEERAYLCFKALVTTAVGLAFLVVVTGAYVRLSDAGLGCPDWPGCYGHMIGIPQTQNEIQLANEAFGDRAFDAPKAWKEMIHRYLAGTLGLLVLAIMLVALRDRHRPQQPVLLPAVLVLLVVFQMLLGMWTVTLQLQPAVVMGHLLGGFATLSLLWWATISGLSRISPRSITQLRRYRIWAIVGAVILLIQIALGGWTSSNYAGLACPDFPTCQHRWWPEMDFPEAFVLWRGTEVNYEFGVLDNPARTAIHIVHRIGALITGIYLTLLGSALLRHPSAVREVRSISSAMIVLVVIQLLLGISNVVFHLPLSMAVAHNAVAALLLLTVLSLVYVLISPSGYSPAMTLAEKRA